MRAWLRFFRVPLAPTAAFDSAACLGLALTGAHRSLGSTTVLDWVLLAATSLALYAFGMGLNDIADRKRDRMLAPERPLPSGDLGVESATFVTLLLGGTGVAIGGGPLGLRASAIAVVVCAALYDLALKRNLVAGALSLGLARFFNASIAVWPLVLTGRASGFTLLAPAAIGVYAAAVTVWSTTEEPDLIDVRPRRLAARILAILAFATAGILPWIVAGRPTLGVLIAGGAVSSLAFARTPRPGPAKRQVLEMLLGLYFLSMAVASGADGGSMASSLVALGIALALIYSSQRMIRALRPATHSP